MSPTQRSLALMKERGFSVFIVEYWHAFARCRKDLFGFVDILCLGDNELVGVQCCAIGDVSKRVNKIADHENLPSVRRAGIKLLVQGWGKAKKRGEVKFREVDVS